MKDHRENVNVQPLSRHITGLLISIVIAFLIPSNLQVSFWAKDLPPLTQQLKFIYNLLIFLLCVQAKWERLPTGDSPLQVPDIHAYSNPRFFSPQGLMKYIGLGTRWGSLSTLKLLRAILVASWIGSAVGFGGWVSQTLNGLLWLLFHGYLVSVKGTNHRWYLPTYAMVTLSIANTAEYSVDNFLHQRLPWWPFYYAGPSSELWGSLARKLITYFAMMTLFGGFISKLRNTGLIWGDGVTLQYYVSREEGKWDFLRKLTTNTRWFAAFLATGSLILEAAAILAMFEDTTRTLLFVGALGLHIGIYLVMYPSYGPQSVTYMLCISWQYAPLGPEVVASPSLQLMARIATVIAIFILIGASYLLEWWPITCIPMYSFNRTGFFQKYIVDVKQAKYVSREYMLSNYPWPIAWAKDWLVVRVTPHNQEPLKNPFQPLPIGYKILPKHLRRFCHKVGAADILSKYNKESLTSENGTSESPANEFVNILAQHYRKYASSWLQTQEQEPVLELILNLKDGPIAIGRTKISLKPYEKTPPHLGIWVNELKIPGRD